jgi:hypothetical protein
VDAAHTLQKARATKFNCPDTPSTMALKACKHLIHSGVVHVDDEVAVGLQLIFFLLFPLFSLFSLPNYKGALSLKFDIQFGSSSFGFHFFCLCFFIYF